jgi:mono/diheme cytochrome c family protein
MRFMGQAFLASGLLLSAFSAAAAQDTRLDPGPLEPFFRKYCSDCHMEGASKGGLDLDRAPVDLRDAESLRRWVRLYDRVAAGEMPPPKKDRAPAAERKAFLQALEGSLTRADLARRKVVLRRLNRIEYENSVRDLFGVHVDVRDLLPEDASLYGFDTMGEALAASAELVTAYLEAADAVLDAAYGPDKEPKRLSVRFPLLQDVQAHVGNLFRETPDGVALFSAGYCPSTARSFRPQDAGTYRVRIHAKGFQSERPVTMRVEAGDVIVHRRPFRVVGFFDLPTDRLTTVEFTERFARGDTFHPKPFGTAGSGKHDHPGPGIVVGDVEVEGPLEAWPPPSREALLGGADPVKGTIEDARRVLAGLLPRAFRRPPAPGAVEPFLALVQARLDAGRPYREALRVGLKGVLLSPDFLFRREPAAEGRVDDFALAARLSYFLWSTAPDEALLDAAATGRLRTPAGLREETERLLRSPKAAAFTRHFTGQWLQLRDIDFTEPDKKLYPEFDDLLKASMVAETEATFAEILGEDRSLLEFIDSGWAMLNARLAEHYGIPGIEGQALRRVALPKDSPRGGVLTQGAVLKVTANGSNTSPVIRGVWILDKILGQPAPPPPPGVPAVEPDIRGTTTLREQLAKHRYAPSCGGCHVKIDPPGFALENFDVIGGWRDRYRSLGVGDRVDRFVDRSARVRVQYRLGPPVDASGETASGEAFKDVRDFKRILLQDPDALGRALAGKLLAYALGRGIGFSDREDVARIVAAVRERNYGFRSLVHEVVRSAAFVSP